MGIEIREIAKNDLITLFSLMREFAEYEKLAELLDLKPEKYEAAMFGPNAYVSGLVADLDSAPVGFVLFYPCFSTFRSMPGMYLEDLFVSEKARGKGIGKLLLKAVARRAAENGFERIDFQVLEWNAPAIGFYSELGAVLDAEDRHFKFTGNAFQNLLGE